MNANPSHSVSSGHRDEVWTEDRIRALGAVTDLPTAARIFGLGRSLAYDLARTDQFPALVIRAGTRYRVPIAGILTALGLPTSPDLTSSAKPSVDHHDGIRPSDHDERGEP
ncbi:DNA-binding protein [Actinoplanes sp. NPDC023714]|uniref:DNA-binding protein n=1 Tax=Actinoplanes sp. NPDC023714 TaxID=3154322 RepID=UPI0033D08029